MSARSGPTAWSSSWRGGLAALYTSWFGYTPWALLSVSALGPAVDTARTPPLLPALVVGVFASVLIAALCLRWNRAFAIRAIAVAALGVWVTLDLGWLADLHAKHALTESLYSGKSWQDRARLVPDQQTAAVAEQVRTFLAGQENSRLMVASDSNYTLLRLLYLLLPLNVAPMSQAVASAGTAALPNDSLFLLYENTAWNYDERAGVLTGSNRSVPVTLLFENGDMHLYRLRTSAP